MAINSINAADFKKMLINGAINLKNNCREIDRLNVFPVPDGDTGTNMKLTILNGIIEVKKEATNHIGNITKAMSKGCLLGARGNSGVILSQFFKGISSYFEQNNNDEVTKEELFESFVMGKDQAYKAVIEPVEGTILTVLRLACFNTLGVEYESFLEFLKGFYKNAQNALNETPNLLPCLKEASVVDSGGAGLLKILEGFILYLEGTELEDLEPTSNDVISVSEFSCDITFAYCTEFIVRTNKEITKEEIIEKVKEYGDSLVCVIDDDLLKIHIHSNKPGDLLNIAQEYGEFISIKIENMKEQHSNLSNGANCECISDISIICVSNGSGVSQAFREIGVNNIYEIKNGINPSTSDFINLIKQIKSENIIIVPNNKNIFLSALQAKDMVDDKNIRILKTTNIAEGYSALITFDPTISLDENITVMQEALDSISSCELTYSIKDTVINDIEIKANNYIAIKDNDILCANVDKINCFYEMLDKTVDENVFSITCFYGIDVDSNELEIVKNYFIKAYPNIDTVFIEGKQSVYSYIISIER